jgi:hypothetical protein
MASAQRTNFIATHLGGQILAAAVSTFAELVTLH